MNISSYPVTEKTSQDVLTLPGWPQLTEDQIHFVVDSIKEFFKKSNIKNLYVSIDIDALDPSVAPGTGYAIPGGFSYRDIWKILKEITEVFNVIGFDLVEVAPNLDLENKMTCILAAKLIVEFMYFIRSKNLY